MNDLVPPWLQWRVDVDDEEWQSAESVCDWSSDAWEVHCLEAALCPKHLPFLATIHLGSEARWCPYHLQQEVLAHYAPTLSALRDTVVNFFCTYGVCAQASFFFAAGLLWIIRWTPFLGAGIGLNLDGLDVDAHDLEDPACDLRDAPCFHKSNRCRRAKMLTKIAQDESRPWQSEAWRQPPRTEEPARATRPTLTHQGTQPGSHKVEVVWNQSGLIMFE